VADQSLLAAIELIYDAAPDPKKWPQVLAAIADCLGDVGAILIWRKDDGAFGTIVSPSLVEAQADYEQNWATRDFKAVLAEKLGLFLSGEPFADRHISTEEDTRKHPFFQNFLLRQGLGWCAAIAVSPDPYIGVMLVVQRDARARPQYSDAEIAVVGTIGRHIEKSLRLSLRLFDAERSSLGLGEALAGLGIGAFALDSLGRVVFQNAAATRLVKTHFSIVQRKLKVNSNERSDQFRAAVRRAIDAKTCYGVADDRPLVIEANESVSPLVLYFLPISRPPSSTEQLLTQTRVIVLAVEPRIGAPADPALVRDIFGVTLGEARVAALVGIGLPPRETAERLGIAEETARNLLKRVFSKMGISRQSELAALLSKLVVSDRKTTA
jgi:DNA-binding CsgD family transcriptional regulator